MKFTPEEINSKRCKAAYKQLIKDVSEILCRHDPINICGESNRDEYEPAAKSIIAKLRGCASEEDVRKVVHRVFVGWFDQYTAGPESRYAGAGAEIWAAWRATLKGKKGSRKSKAVDVRQTDVE